MRRATALLATSKWTLTSPRPSRWTRPAECASPESSASRSQSVAGAIAASSFRRSSESDTLELQQTTFVRDPGRAVRTDPVGGDHPVTGHDDREPVARAERAGGALGARVAGAFRDLGVRDDVAVRDRAKRGADVAFERCRAV